MKIFKLITLSIIVLMFSYSCKKGEAKQKEFNNEIITDSTDIMKNNLPYTSDSVKRYYKLDADSISHIVNPLHKELVSADFDEKNKAIPIKENDFEIESNSKYKYYVLETFKFSDTNTAKLIIYNTFGENDSKILNTQLNWKRRSN